MNAAEADDSDGAQLCWTGSRQFTGTFDRRTRPCASAADAKGFFDVFEDLGEKDSATSLAVPITAVQYDIAAGDLDDSPPLASKQYQDDLSTPGVRKLWADVVDDDDHFEDLVDDATADADSRGLQDQSGPIAHGLMKVPSCTQQAPCTELRTQCGPSVTTSCNELHEPCAPDDSDTKGYDYHSGPQSDIHVSGDITVMQGGFPQTLRTQFGLLPSEGFEAIVDPGRGRSEPVVAAAAVAAAAAESLKGEAATHVAASDPDSPGSVASVGFATGHLDFQDFARSVLPDVFPSTGSSEQGTCSDLDSVTSADDHSPDGELAPLPLRGTGSPGTSPGGGQGQGTQCGPLPLDADSPQIARTQCGPLTLPRASTLARHAPQEEDSHKDPTDSEVAPATQTMRTQCGHLPQQHLLSPCAPGLSNASTHVPGEALCPQTSRTQCGPLPLDDDHDFFPNGGSIFDSDPFHAFDDSAQCEPMPQSQSSGSPTSCTQCGPLPQQHSPRASRDPLAGLQTSLKQLLDVSLEPNRAPLDTRTTFLEAYAAATRQFELEFGLDESPGIVDMSSLLVAGTQCGPLPQLGPSPIQAAKDKTLAQHAPQELKSARTMPTPRTQCGPLPQLGPSPIQATNDKTLAQQAPQELVSARTMPTPRTQCGPLPQQSMQATFIGPSAAKDKQLGRDKRKGKGKGKGKGILP